MKPSFACAVASALGLLGFTSVFAQSAPAPAPARSRLVYVDVQVSSNDGQSVADLAPAAFEITIDGRPRPVIAALATRVPPSRDETSRGAANTMQYHLGIQPDAGDADGAVHEIQVRVNAANRALSITAPAQVRFPALEPQAAPPGDVAPGAGAPTDADVTAWQRLWGGADALAAAEKAEAARVAAAGRADAARQPAASSAASRTPTAPDAEASGNASLLDRLFGTYSAGDSGVLLRELRTSADFERVRPDAVRALARWREEPWSRERSVFALELALTAFVRRWPNPQSFLNAARDVMTSRPDAPGANPAHDDVERRFHRAAVALLAAVDGPHAVEAYLTSIQNRVRLAESAAAPNLLDDPALLLAQATAREAQTQLLLLSIGNSRDEPRTWVAAKDDDRTRRRLEDLNRLLARAAEAPEAADEAAVRQAFVLHRLGRHQDALDRLGRVQPDDDVVAYWQCLIEGRVLLGLGRDDDAVDAFERATTLFPDAQTPAVALTSLFTKRGDREQALGWAERARTTTENRGDPWPLYWGGSARFLATWFDDLRARER